jgi:uncharacterized protein (TIGR02246 family)
MRKAELLGGIAAILMAAVPLSAFAEGQPPPGVQLQYLIDRAGVEDLLAKYAKAVDFGTPEDYAALFTEDGVIHMQGKDFKGRDAIRKMITPALAKPAEGAPARPRMRHILSNVDIELNGDTATVFESWATISKGADGHVGISAIGHYTDTVVKVNGQWLFAKRVIDVDLANTPPGKN